VAEPSSALGTGEVVRLVAGREIRERLRAKSFYLFTAVLVVAILAMGVISRLAGADEPSAVRVGVTEPVPEGFSAALTATAELLDREAEVTTYADTQAAERALGDEAVDVAVVTGDNRAVFPEAVDDETFTLVQQAWSAVSLEQRLLEQGLRPDQVETALATTQLQAASLDGDDEASGLAVLTGTLAAILLFISLQTFGGYVLTGVVEEKATAVVEVLLVRARADQLLAGKILGIGVAALLQFALAVAAGVAALAISGIDVPGEIWSAVPMTLLWFLGGYAFYSTLFALAGSLVSRQEEAQAASAPILTVLIGAYLLIFVFGYVPDSTASTVMSLIPPIAPMLMPMRMAAGAASPLEVVAALLLLALATFAAWKLAGRIYEQVLLRRGSRISWRSAFSLLSRG
jgi:ABC-2 type transport system permease protein